MYCSGYDFPRLGCAVDVQLCNCGVCESESSTGPEEEETRDGRLTEPAEMEGLKKVAQSLFELEV